MFLDVVQEDVQMQVMFNMGQLEKMGYASASELDRVRKEVRVGDWYRMGSPISSVFHITHITPQNSPAVLAVRVRVN
jgi:hypothetical protein